jgi:hypothetical protein
MPGGKGIGKERQDASIPTRMSQLDKAWLSLVVFS